MNKKIASISIIALIFATITLGAIWIWEKREMKQIVEKERQIQEESEKRAEEIKKIKETQQAEIDSIKDLVDGEYVFENVDTSDWQTYRNEEMGFEVNIPKDFKSNKEDTNKNYAYFVNNLLDASKIEKEISFSIVIYEKLHNKKLSNINEKDLYDPIWSSFVSSGNVNVAVKKGNIKNIEVVLVKSIFKKEPTRNIYGGWIEGAWDDEAFFQCGNNICSIRISSHQYSIEKEALFYRVLSTLNIF